MKDSGGSFYEKNIGVKLLTAGTAACFADVLSFPVDTAKVRLQIQGKGSTQYKGLIGTITTITRQEGPRALYNGLSAGLQRQMCFASVRIGLYDSVKNFYQSFYNDQSNTIRIIPRVSAGITTGALSVFIAQPTDVVKIRFQAQNKSLSSVSRYKSTTSAYKTIFRDEGLRGLWKGTSANVIRCSIVNVSETVCYDIIKDSLILYVHMKDNIFCHIASAFVAGLATTIVSSPIDVVKTRYMNAGKGEYSSALHLMATLYKREGFLAFYKGFIPNFVRMVSWNLILWLTYEQLKKISPSNKNKHRLELI